MNALDQALRAIVADLRSQKAGFALVGGLAVSAWVEPRFTGDADLAISVDWLRSGWREAPPLSTFFSLRPASNRRSLRPLFRRRSSTDSMFCGERRPSHRHEAAVLRPGTSTRGHRGSSPAGTGGLRRRLGGRRLGMRNDRSPRLRSRSRSGICLSRPSGPDGLGRGRGDLSRPAVVGLAGW